VIATGESRTVKELVETAFGLAGLDWERYVQLDSAYVRPAEVNHLCGDPSKAYQQLGWRARITFTEMIREMLEVDLGAHGIDPATVLKPTPAASN